MKIGSSFHCCSIRNAYRLVILEGYATKDRNCS